MDLSAIRLNRSHNSCKLRLLSTYLRHRRVDAVPLSREAVSFGCKIINKSGRVFLGVVVVHAMNTGDANVKVRVEVMGQRSGCCRVSRTQGKSILRAWKARTQTPGN